MLVKKKKMSSDDIHFKGGPQRIQETNKRNDFRPSPNPKVQKVVYIPKGEVTLQDRFTQVKKLEDLQEFHPTNSTKAVKEKRLNVNSDSFGKK